jgi:hypothetical protein
MPSAFSLWAIAVIMTSLFGSALSFRAPVDELFKRKSRFDVKAKLTKRDLICVEDDVLLAFQEYPDTVVPFCRSYIGIPQQTTVSTVTTKTFDALVKDSRGSANVLLALSSN